MKDLNTEARFFCATVLSPEINKKLEYLLVKPYSIFLNVQVSPEEGSYDFQADFMYENLDLPNYLQHLNIATSIIRDISAVEKHLLETRELRAVRHSSFYGKDDMLITNTPGILLIKIDRSNAKVWLKTQHQGIIKQESPILFEENKPYGYDKDTHTLVLRPNADCLTPTAIINFSKSEWPFFEILYERMNKQNISKISSEDMIKEYKSRTGNQVPLKKLQDICRKITRIKFKKEHVSRQVDMKYEKPGLFSLEIMW